jgi:hypothetical protein
VLLFMMVVVVLEVDEAESIMDEENDDCNDDSREDPAWGSSGTALCVRHRRETDDTADEMAL